VGRWTYSFGACTYFSSRTIIELKFRETKLYDPLYPLNIKDFVEQINPKMLGVLKI